jgi:hypothetical protein
LPLLFELKKMNFFQIKVLKKNLINFLIFNFGHFCLKLKKNTKKNQNQILDTRHKLQGFKLQFEIYLVPTKPLVVPETLRKLIQILMGRTVYHETS